MGFGILFIGYFLLLNFAYQGYTDAICAVLTLYGLYKLSGINKGFRYSAVVSVGFLALGIASLVITVGHAFGLFKIPDALYTVISCIRYLVVGATSVLMLHGMRDVLREVGLKPLSYKCEQLIYMTYPIYGAGAVFELLGLTGWLGAKVMAFLSVFLIVANLTLIVLTLINIYSCYMRICMPNQREMTEKESKFGFVNAFRKHEMEKQKEYSEYRIEQQRKRNERKARKKK